MKRLDLNRIPKFRDGDSQNSKIIVLRSNLNESNLRRYIFRFFRETKFNSKYIYILINKIFFFN